MIVYDFDGNNFIFKNEVPTVVPSKEQQILSTLAKQVMDLQIEDIQQKQINVSLTKQIMNLKGDETHE